MNSVWTNPLFMRLKQQRLWQFGVFVLKRCLELRLFQVSSSLTFTTLLALVPFFTIALTVVSAFPMFEDITRQFQQFITNNLVPQASYKVINDYVFGFLDNASKLTTIGLIMLIVSAVLLINTIETTFNQIWGSSQPRPLLTRLLVYWALLTLGPLILGLTISQIGWFMRQSVFAFQYPNTAWILHFVISTLVNTALLWLMYRVVPARYVPSKHALAGALWSAIILELAKRLFSYYFSHFGSYEIIYGAFAVIPLFLLWINVLWVILLAQAQCQGSSMPTRAFRSHINMGYDELGELLEQLQHYHYVTRDNDGWLLKTNPYEINLREVFEIFVYRPSTNPNDHIGSMVQNYMQPSLSTLSMTLADFVQQSNLIKPPQQEV